MKQSHLLKISLICVIALFAVAGATQAATGAELVASMSKRLPAVMELKMSGQVGESNIGMLEVRGELSRVERRLVADENRDRVSFYKQIAQRVGAPLSQVQAERAEDIREKSPKGVWLQSARGDWYQK